MCIYIYIHIHTYILHNIIIIIIIIIINHMSLSLYIYIHIHITHITLSALGPALAPFSLFRLIVVSSFRLLYFSFTFFLRRCTCIWAGAFNFVPT